MARTNREDIYVSPVVIVELFNDTKAEVGDDIFKFRKYKVLREGWVAAMFAVTLSMYQGGIWWLRPNKEDTAPDFYAFNRKHIPGEDYMEGVNWELEVFEWKSDNSLTDAIKNKVKNWKAPKISVIAYASKPNQSLNFSEIHDELFKSDIDVLEIWVLVKLKGQPSYFVYQVYPHLFVIPVPTGVPNYFKEPYSFMSKHKSKVDTPGGLLHINEQMEIFEVDEIEQVDAKN